MNMLTFRNSIRLFLMVALFLGTIAHRGKDLYIQQGKFHAQFAADMPANDAQLMAST